MIPAWTRRPRAGQPSSISSVFGALYRAGTGCQDSPGQGSAEPFLTGSRPMREGNRSYSIPPEESFMFKKSTLLALAGALTISAAMLSPVSADAKGFGGHGFHGGGFKVHGGGHVHFRPHFRPHWH